MITNVVLLIDNRDVMSTKYKKILLKNNFSVFHLKSMDEAQKIILNHEPEIILISDSLGTDMAQNIETIRAINTKTRPCVVALSKSNDINDKLKVLNSGADDYFPEPIEFLEFIGRLKAHLRRTFESQLNDITMLFGNKITTKILKRTLNDNVGYSYLYITIKNIDSYKDLYGDIAYSKMLQTLCAILSSCLDKKDYLGHFIQDSIFLVITSQSKIENIAKYMIYAFNKVKEKFYAKNDVSRGFLIMKGDVFEETKTSFVKMYIGGVINSYKKYTNINELLHALVYINKLASLKDESNYLIERHQLAANDSVVEKKYNNNVMIIEKDEPLSLLLETQCKLHNYNVLNLNDSQVILENSTFQPSVIILDAGSVSNFEGVDLCKKIKSMAFYQDAKIILTTIFHDKQTILKSGADLYLPKPYNIDTVISWVKRFNIEYNL